MEHDDKSASRRMKDSTRILEVSGHSDICEDIENRYLKVKIPHLDGKCKVSR